MKRRLIWVISILMLAALAILVVDAFKKAHAAENNAANVNPWQIINKALVKINDPDPEKNIRIRIQNAAQNLSKGEGWEGEARKELASAAADADAIIKLLNPLIEKQNPPYPKPVLARANHIRAYAMLLKFAATLQVLKSNGTVAGREDRELLGEISDIISVFEAAVSDYAAPESVREFGLKWVENFAIPDIQKSLPVLQQVQGTEQGRQQQQGSQAMDGKSEKDIMKMILGENLGQNKPKNINVVVPLPSDKKGKDNYSPGERKLR